MFLFFYPELPLDSDNLAAMSAVGEMCFGRSIGTKSDVPTSQTTPDDWEYDDEGEDDEGDGCDWSDEWDDADEDEEIDEDMFDLGGSE